MSYCVHCGVELDPSLKRCPLCETPVLDPKNIPYFEVSSPYPSKKGQVEPAKRKDAAVLVSILLLTIGVTCGLLNFLVFSGTAWSLIVVSFCLLLWIICVPFLICNNMSPYLAIFLDYLTVSFCLYLISLLTGSSRWLVFLGLPITTLFAVFTEIFLLFYLHVSRSAFFVALYLFCYIAFSSIGIELLCRNYLQRDLRITWSAIVLTVCFILSIAIITILLRPRLKEETTKRLHL